MSVLAIETSTERLGVALIDDSRVLASYELLAERPHAIELPQAIHRVLQEGRCALDQLEGIAIDIGPGSFTGLRIGVAFLKALNVQAKRPVVGVPSLDVLAANARYADSLVCPILDAKQRKVYAALYRAQDGAMRKQSDYQLISVEELCAGLPEEPVLFLGDGIGLYRERLTQQLGPRALFAAPDLWWPSAATLGCLGRERLGQGQRDDLAALVPMYLYPRDCTIRSPQSPPTPSKVS